MHFIETTQKMIITTRPKSRHKFARNMLTIRILHSPLCRILLALTILLDGQPNLSSTRLVEASFKRCFNCRSRGPLGDCRDPFTLNSTTFDGQTNSKPSIEAVPCSSGWCAKIIEDDYGDSIMATERSCMTRPPTDNEERCSETLFENHRDRKVFLCMCYGDLCNGSIGQMSISIPICIFTLCLSIIHVTTAMRRTYLPL